MIVDNINALNAAKARISKLERLIDKRLPRELATLPGVYGFTNVGLFLRAVKAAATKRGLPAKKSAILKHRKRAKITDAIRAKVRSGLKSGKTCAQMAKELRISLPSVQNIKKALGLMRKSKRPARKSKARNVPAGPSSVEKLQTKQVSLKKQLTAESTLETRGPAPSS